MGSTTTTITSAETAIDLTTTTITSAPSVRAAALRSPHQLGRHGSSSRVPYPKPIQESPPPAPAPETDGILGNTVSWMEARDEAAKKVAERAAAAMEPPVYLALAPHHRSQSRSPAERSVTSEAASSDLEHFLTRSPASSPSPKLGAKGVSDRTASISPPQQVPTKPYWADETYSPTPSPSPALPVGRRTRFEL